jgi:hypothetical protein
MAREHHGPDLVGSLMSGGEDSAVSTRVSGLHPPFGWNFRKNLPNWTKVINLLAT